MLDYYIIINTFEREQELYELLAQLTSWKPSGTTMKIKVYLDGCDYGCEGCFEEVEFVRVEHHGRENYYKLVQRNIQEIERAKYYIKLDDDLTLDPYFFEMCTRNWNSIQDPMKLTLMLLKDRRHSQWGAPDPKSYNDYVLKTWWCDMIFMFSKEFIKFFNQLTLYPPDMESSSRVGAQISKKLRDYGGMYQVKETLVFHGDHESKMNPEERKKNPLINN